MNSAAQARALAERGERAKPRRPHLHPVSFIPGRLCLRVRDAICRRHGKCGALLSDSSSLGPAGSAGRSYIRAAIPIPRQGSFHGGPRFGIPKLWRLGLHSYEVTKVLASQCWDELKESSSRDVFVLVPFARSVRELL